MNYCVRWVTGHHRDRRIRIGYAAVGVIRTSGQLYGDHWPYTDLWRWRILTVIDKERATMANNIGNETVVESQAAYCRTCGHEKGTHNLDFRGDPTVAHRIFSQGYYVCQHMTGAHSAEHCICVGWSSWV